MKRAILMQFKNKNQLCIAETLKKSFFCKKF